MSLFLQFMLFRKDLLEWIRIDCFKAHFFRKFYFSKVGFAPINIQNINAYFKIIYKCANSITQNVLPKPLNLYKIVPASQQKMEMKAKKEKICKSNHLDGGNSSAICHCRPSLKTFMKRWNNIFIITKYEDSQDRHDCKNLFNSQP